METPSDEPHTPAELRFYKERGMDAATIAQRHSMVGYDPLDKALRNARVQVSAERAPAADGRATSQTDALLAEYKASVRHLLTEHLETMAETGLVFHHVFQKKRFGFSILVARYGDEGRNFVEIEETHPACELHPGPLKPTDELIAVNDELILDPSPETFDAILQSLVKAARPVKLTFIQGEHRDEAFEAQEARHEKEAEERAKREAAEAAVKAEADAKAAAEAEAVAEAEAKADADRAAREAEAKALLEAARAKREAEDAARAKADAERAERAAAARAEEAAKAKAEEEARATAKAEAAAFFAKRKSLTADAEASKKAKPEEAAAAPVMMMGGGGGGGDDDDDGKAMCEAPDDDDESMVEITDSDASDDDDDDDDAAADDDDEPEMMGGGGGGDDDDDDRAMEEPPDDDEKLHSPCISPASP